jgi:hypothetical protein
MQSTHLEDFRLTPSTVRVLRITLQADVPPLRRPCADAAAVPVVAAVAARLFRLGACRFLLLLRLVVLPLRRGRCSSRVEAAGFATHTAPLACFHQERTGNVGAGRGALLLYAVCGVRCAVCCALQCVLAVWAWPSRPGCCGWLPGCCGTAVRSGRAESGTADRTAGLIVA